MVANFLAAVAYLLRQAIQAARLILAANYQAHQNFVAAQRGGASSTFAARAFLQAPQISQQLPRQLVFIASRVSAGACSCLEPGRCANVGHIL